MDLMQGGPVNQDAEMADLFGGDEDVEDASKDHTADTESEHLGPEEIERRRLEYEEDEIPPDMAVEVREAEVSFPNLPVPRSSDGDHWVVRLPSYISVDSKPFHPDTYVGLDDEESQQESAVEQSMTIKLKLENTLRWRWGKDSTGNDVRRSNSRIIRWSDGSLSLRLGKELYDISQNVDTSGGISRKSFGSSSGPAVPVTHTPGGRSQGLTYLVAQHKRSQVLQSEAVITGTMSLRPTSMNSEAHQMLVRSVGQKHKKKAGIQMAALPEKDPERELVELKKQTDKRDRKRERELYGASSRAPRKRSRMDVYSDEDEEEEDARDGYGNTDDEDGASPAKARKNGEKKTIGEGEYHDDGFVVQDFEDSEEEGSPKKKTRRGDESDDNLDKLERRIESQSRKKSHRQPPKVPQSEDAAEPPDASPARDTSMSIESEEDDDEFKIRKAKSGGRKLALDDDVDEE